jgi:hypothetical protein
MDKKKILLLNLSKGRIGEDNSALLGAMIITKLQLAAMSRVDIPEDEREDFYLYVDEFQNFATESFANILSEARKYRLNLIVAHQYIGQLVSDRNTVVRDAIFGNVGTMIAFRVGADDAEFLEKEFEPTYTMNDLVNLAKWNIYLKLMISANTLPPISEPTGNEEKVITVSRERYGTPRVVVEEKISKWLGAEYHAEAAKVESESVGEEEAQETMRYNDQFRPKEENRIQPPPQKIASQIVPPESKPAVQQPAPKVAAPEPKPVRKREEPRQERPDRGHRRQIERRAKQSEVHPNRRQADKPQKQKVQNPVWDTVTKLSIDKLKERAEKTAAALESLGASLEKSLKLEGPQSATKKWEHQESIPSVPDEIEMSEADLAPPTGNPQSHLTMLDHKDHPSVADALKKVPKTSKLKPGDKVTFD